MAEKKGRGGGPPPQAEMAQRLEAVRERFGVPSLRAFHARLDEGWEEADPDGRVSYEAVRNYHYDRDAPVAYLARVVEVFPGVRLGYLASGDGEMLEEEERARLTVEAGDGAGLDYRANVVGHIREGFGDGGERLFESRVREAALLHTWKAFVSGNTGAFLFIRDGEHAPGEFIGRALRAPFDAMRIHPNLIPEDAFTEYVLASCTGLRHLAGAAGKAEDLEEEDTDE